MTNLAENLTRTAATHPDRVGLRVDDTTVTWRELDDAASRFAGFLRAKGIGPGDRVALSLPNVPNFAVVAYGVWRAGAVLVPMNPLFMAREIEYYLKDAGVKLAIGMPGEVSKTSEKVGVEFLDGMTGLGSIDATPAPQNVERAGDDTAVILYTSGTTGRPKGAELSHDALHLNQEISARTLFHLQVDDVILGCLPLFHVFGLTCTMNTSVATGNTLTLLPRFDPKKAIEIIQRDQVTMFVGVPTMYQAILEVAKQGESIQLPSLRVCASGGSAMPVEVLHAFEKRFDTMILEGYGLSETSPVASFNHPDAVRKPGSIGTPIEGVEMAIFDTLDEELPTGEVGEIVIRGHLLMKGYWDKPEATEQAIRDGWFHSGDLGYRDEDGYFFIVDRAKDMIIRGGYNVYPREVEEVLYEHPDIREVAVVGLPHDHYGEEVAAYVVLRPGSQLDEEAVQSFAKERLAAYKYPRVVRFIDELPKGATGKILKRELR